MDAIPQSLLSADLENAAGLPRRAWTWLRSWFDMVVDSFSLRLPWAPRCLPLVERIELHDRDIYKLLTGVSVRRTWKGEYWIYLELPGIDPLDLVTNVAAGRLVLEVANRHAANGGRRSYSFALPEDCDHATLETRVRDDGLMMVVS